MIIPKEQSLKEAVESLTELDETLSYKKRMLAKI